jgi:hypothetical protein
MLSFNKDGADILREIAMNHKELEQVNGELMTLNSVRAGSYSGGLNHQDMWREAYFLIKITKGHSLSSLFSFFSFSLR